MLHLSVCRWTGILALNSSLNFNYISRGFAAALGTCTQLDTIFCIQELAKYSTTYACNQLVFALPENRICINILYICGIIAVSISGHFYLSLVVYIFSHICRFCERSTCILQVHTSASTLPRPSRP